MNESQYRLKEKTIIIAGPLNSLIQSITCNLAELGADVAIINQQYSQTQRFA